MALRFEINMQISMKVISLDGFISVFNLVCSRPLMLPVQSGRVRLLFNELTKLLICYYIQQMTLNLRKLLSISTQLSLQACHVIRQGLQDHSFKEYMKGEDDPVTDADFKIQSMIIKGLRMHFPNLKIIGEESEEFKGSIDFQYQKLQPDMLPATSNIDRELKIEDACLWIDPIDCTRGFINGNLEDVTILIGLSYCKKPQAGIIGTPYRLHGDQKLFAPVVTVGSVKQKETFDFNGLEWQRKEKPKIHSPIIVATSNTRRSREEDSFMRTLRAQDIRAGGSGRKIMMVANGQADAMVYLQSWTHKWDSCAGDAIIKSMGGYFTSPFGVNLTYDPTALSTENKQGMVAALDRQVFQRCMDAMAYF